MVDVVAVWLALAGTYLAAEQIGDKPAVVAPDGVMLAMAIGLTLMWPAVFMAYGLYERQTRAIAPRSLDEILDLFHALLAGSLVLLVVDQGTMWAFDWAVYSPLESLMFLTCALVLVPLGRSCVRTFVLPNVLRPRRALIVGAGPEGRIVQRKLEAHPEFSLQVIGFVDDERDRDVLGTHKDLPRLIDTLEVDWVVVATTEPTNELLDLMREVRRPDVHLSIVPSYSELFASNATLEELEGIPIVSLPPMRLSRSIRTVKRAIDLVASGLGLLALSPLLAVIAIAIRIDSPGPIFFRQRRHGRGGSEFKIVKFRTMVADAEAQRLAMAHMNEMEGSGPLFKMANDPRITKVGAFLRKTSLDELPQLWNVLRGEMSLVGPRPFVVHESEQITGWAGRRLDTTPGITGLWQILGRNDIPFDEMVKLDYVYVTNWSLWWDIKILLRTIPTVLGRKGAY
ncbi:sugar transferase [Solirubrobacter phytolaccae]|uniref:Sugar transferase n=1 Tax=Solirubrobacter phytolaccae TaxID=1404360 RepID=A0A9X3N8F3_9ACTN|nr:sugar transferase [Solirubrobacter phytolaccae]MDA0180330.1 sugar transferase [Solirubrobacter phytolaccae]